MAFIRVIFGMADCIMASTGVFFSLAERHMAVIGAFFFLADCDMVFTWAFFFLKTSVSEIILDFGGMRGGRISARVLCGWLTQESNALILGKRDKKTCGSEMIFYFWGMMDGKIVRASLAGDSCRKVMKRRYLLVLISLLLSWVSCAPVGPFTSKTKPEEVTELLKFETLSLIYLFEKGNKAFFNDSLSKISKNYFDGGLRTLSKIPVSSFLSVDDTSLQNRIDAEILFLQLSAEKNNRVSEISITPLIDSLLEANGKRFGLLTITHGFTRTKGNYRGQIGKGVATGILTLGMFYTVPIKATTSVYALIADSKSNNLAFYQKSSVQDQEPLDSVYLARQTKYLFEGYFLPKNRNR